MLTFASRGRLAVFAATAVLFLFLQGTPAHAQGGRDDNPYCAVEVFAIGDPRKSVEPVCFATKAEVDRFLNAKGSVKMDSVARGSSSRVAIGTVYKDQSGGGASLTFWGASGCAGVTFGFPSLASGWDNSISSVRGANGCWVTAYTSTNYNGARLNCTPYCSALNGWNDNVRSLVFRPAGSFG